MTALVQRCKLQALSVACLQYPIFVQSGGSFETILTVSDNVLQHLALTMMLEVTIL